MESSAGSGASLGARASGSDLFEEAVLAAREGSYVEALETLRESQRAGGCGEAQALDLEARIYAQQGLYLFAESRWQRARAVEPGNPDYERALERLRRAASRGGAPSWHALVVGLVAVMAMALLWSGRMALESTLEEASTAIDRLTQDVRTAAAANSRGVEAMEASLTHLEGRVFSELEGLTLDTDSIRAENGRLLTIALDLAAMSRAANAEIAATVRSTEERLRSRLDSVRVDVRSVQLAIDSLKTR